MVPTTETVIDGCACASTAISTLSDSVVGPQSTEVLKRLTLLVKSNPVGVNVCWIFPLMVSLMISIPLPIAVSTAPFATALRTQDQIQQVQGYVCT
jgi:hypothetical protein